MRSFRSRPVGWRKDSYRHYLAAKGVKTRYYVEKFGGLEVYERGGIVGAGAKLGRGVSAIGKSYVEAAKSVAPQKSRDVTYGEERVAKAIEGLDVGPVPVDEAKPGSGAYIAMPRSDKKEFVMVDKLDAEGKPVTKIVEETDAEGNVTKKEIPVRERVEKGIVEAGYVDVIRRELEGLRSELIENADSPEERAAIIKNFPEVVVKSPDGKERWGEPGLKVLTFLKERKYLVPLKEPVIEKDLLGRVKSQKEIETGAFVSKGALEMALRAYATQVMGKIGEDVGAPRRYPLRSAAAIGGEFRQQDVISRLPMEKRLRIARVQESPSAFMQRYGQRADVGTARDLSMLRGEAEKGYVKVLGKGGISPVLLKELQKEGVE